MSNLAARLAKAMTLDPNMTQVKLAKVCRVRQPSVNDWLSGKSKSMGGEALVRAAEALGVSPKWLATGEGAMVARAASQPAGLDPYKLQVAIVSVRKALETIVVVDEVRVANSIAYAYGESLPLPSPVPPDQMADFDGAVRHHLRGRLADERREKEATGSGAGRDTTIAPKAKKARAGR